MWSNSAILLPMALLAVGARSPGQTACPAAHGGAALTGAAVYDGPVAENAILEPDGASKTRGAEVSTWRVNGTYRAGRQIYLTCDYARQPRVVVRVAQPVRLCRYTEAGRRRSLSCS